MDTTGHTTGRGGLALSDSATTSSGTGKTYQPNNRRTIIIYSLMLQKAQCTNVIKKPTYISSLLAVTRNFHILFISIQRNVM